MSTRSRIGIQLSDGVSVLSVYHHWDGYPQWLGATLEEKFNTREKVAELIDGGDMSSCWSDKLWSNEEQKHIARTPSPEYYSEHGQDCPPELHKDTKEFLQYQSDGEYAYLFTLDNVWNAWATENWSSNKEKVATPVTIPVPAVA